MYLNIQGKHITVTPAINDYIKKRIKKVKEHFDKVLFAHVTIETIKNSHFAEATLSSEHHHFHNRVKSDDMYTSIDSLFQKLEVQVRRYKEQRISRKRKINNINEDLLLHTEEITEVSKKNNIIVEELEIPTKPMNLLEAALQLKVNNKKSVLGFYTQIEDSSHDKPSFIEQLNDKEFAIYDYDHYWEKKEAELIFPDKLEIQTISNVKPGYDFIENAIDYLIHNEARSRFFTSIRLNQLVFLHQINNNRFEIIREKFNETN